MEEGYGSRRGQRGRNTVTIVPFVEEPGRGLGSDAHEQQQHNREEHRVGIEPARLLANGLALEAVDMFRGLGRREGTDGSRMGRGSE